MDDNQRLHLQKMIALNNVNDSTDLIRNLKHSHVLREDVNNLIMLRAKFPDDPEQVHLEGMTTCNFLFTYDKEYTGNLTILFKAFDVLRDIEECKIDQHEGAFEFGNLLKQIYVDSALKKAEKLNAKTGETELEYKGPQVNITWSQFKKVTQIK